MKTDARVQPDQRRSRIVVGEWIVDASTGEAGRNGESIRLEPKAVAVLVQLQRNRGQLVTKHQLLETVWPRTAVSDDVVWRCIAQLRRALEDNPKSPRWIETLPRRGYRLTADTLALGTGDRAPGRLRSRLGLRIGMGLASVALLIIAVRPWAPSSVPRAPDRTTVVAASDPRGWNADEFVRLGREAYRARGLDDVLRAVQLFRQATERDPNLAGAWAGLADAQSALVSWHQGDRDLADQAVASAEHALGLDPELAAGHKALGFARGVSGDAEGAAAAYERALQLQPEYLDAANNLALLHGAFGRYDRAVEILASQQTRPVERAVVLNNIADALLRLGAYLRAEDLLTQAATITPDSVATIEGGIRVALLAGNTRLAAERATDALLRFPDSAPLLNAAADVAMTQERWADAERFFDRSIANDGRGRNITAQLRREWLTRRAADVAPDTPMPWDADLFERAANSTRSWRSAHRVAEYYAAAGRTDQAAEWLRETARRGYLDVDWLSADPIFAPAQRNSGVKRLIESQRAARLAIRERALAALEEPSD